MKKISTIIIAMALLFGMAQCKKQETPASAGKTVHITLNMGNNGSRHTVDPISGAVDYTEGDIIYVGNNGKYIGYLTRENGVFSGDIQDPSTEDYLHFYFLGGKTPATAPTAGTTESFTINIADQSDKLPVLSYAPSTVKYTDENTEYVAILQNQCALAKFTLAAGTTEAVSVAGMLTEATISFSTPSITATETTGAVTLYSESETAKWAILLPQEAVNGANVTIGSDNFTVDVPAVAANGYLNSGIVINNPAHAYVDLGLPSGLLWATCNVGADTPEEYGDYFAWGETCPKNSYSKGSYQYYKYENYYGGMYFLIKYCQRSDYGHNGFIDDLTELLPEDDAATANWGAEWHMPTQAEFQELLDNTSATWTQQNGVNGRLFTASNGNSLFLPAVGERWDFNTNSGTGAWGCYWSSSLYTRAPNQAWCFDFDSNVYGISRDLDRGVGMTVRPVRSAE